MDDTSSKPTKQADVIVLDDDLVVINDIKYRLIENHDKGFDREKIAERYNTILDKYDYIVGDWGYDQLRFKGFYLDKRIESNIDNKISHLEDYLLEYCNFGCAYFVLERVDKLPLTKPKHHKARPKRNQSRHNGRKPNNSNHKGNPKNHHNKTNSGSKETANKPKIRRRRNNDPKAVHKKRRQNRKPVSPKSENRGFKIRKIDK